MHAIPQSRRRAVSIVRYIADIKGRSAGSWPSPGACGRTTYASRGPYRRSRCALRYTGTRVMTHSHSRHTAFSSCVRMHTTQQSSQHARGDALQKRREAGVTDKPATAPHPVRPRRLCRPVPRTEQIRTEAGPNSLSDAVLPSPLSLSAGYACLHGGARLQSPLRPEVSEQVFSAKRKSSVQMLLALWMRRVGSLGAMPPAAPSQRHRMRLTRLVWTASDHLHVIIRQPFEHGRGVGFAASMRRSVFMLRRAVEVRAAHQKRPPGAHRLG